ncbi:MAG TPA: hypothetical protein VGM83_22245 [Devosiaceae bacterium]|jgi:uncharacterized membrane protein YkoI
MNIILRTFVAFLMAATTLTTFAATPAMAADCLGKRDIQQAVSSGKILPLARILSAGGIKSSDVISFQVCPKDGQLYYELQVYSAGDAETVTLNASTGSR